MRTIAASLGLSAVVLFVLVLIVFATLAPDFHYMEDYVSKLGAQGQPHALGWNLIGFLTVGILLAAFGWAYGQVVHDRLVGLLLSAFGVGFAATALPTNLSDAAATLSKGHFVAICLALAAWLVGLARMAQLPALGKATYYSANIAAALVVLPIAGHFAGLWSMPVTHRLVFAVVFGWVAVTSLRLLLEEAHASRSEK